MSYLEQEIHEQPAVLARLLKLERPKVELIVREIGQREIKYLFIAARGSSDNAARYGKYLFSALNRLPVALAAPSLFTLYQRPPCLDGALVIGISQSGRSTEAVEVLREARRQGACTLAITNDADSPLAQMADHVLLCHAGEEHSVAATKTYTAQLASLALLSATMAGDDRRLEALGALPEAVERALMLEDQIGRAIKRYCHMNRCVVIGRGYNWATAHEIALKLKELTHVVAEPYSSADFRHGPVAVIERGFPVLVVAPQGQVYADLYSLIAELHERGADLVVISDRHEAVALSQSPCLLSVAVEEWLSPLITVIPGQLFALHLALTKGFDPDHPRGLNKVTLTR